MSPPIEKGPLEALTAQARWSALVRADESLASIGNWDRQLLRKPRVLVPIDVQALYVPANSSERFVRLPFATTTPDGQDPEPMPAPFDPGGPRPAGVHLHWAMPDALLSGTLEEQEPGSDNRLSLPPLPDRWVVLRLTIARGAQRATVTGWVIDAATTAVTALADWPAADKARPPTGKTLAADQLTGAAGGALHWSGGYDAVANRFAFYDPLTDLATVAPNGVLGDFASYVVCGWWSTPSLDPLDTAKTSADLYARLDALRWRLTDDLEDRGADSAARLAKEKMQSDLTLESAERYKTFAFATGAAAAAQPYAAVGGLFAESASVLGAAVTREPYASLLHGTVHGVPVNGAVVADQRPPASAATVAFGLHSDDIAAVFASAGLNLSTPADRRDVERLVSGFAHDLLAGVGTANGVVDIEEGEHTTAFSSRPGEPGPEERVLAPGTGAELRGTRAARSAGAGKMTGKAIKTLETRLLWSTDRKAKVRADSSDTMRQVREKRDDRTLADAPPAVRRIQRPTPRYFEPLEPLLAVRGAKRNLRHRFDALRSPDGRLQCRWPAQVPVEISGLVKGADLVNAFPAGGLPPEVATLVHSALILDPYVAPWRAEVASQATGLNATAVKNRMMAEVALRYGRDGRFGVGEVATALNQPSSPYAKARLAAALNRFSLIPGVDPDPVSVTAWSQPWVPLWLEWEVELDIGNRLDGWRLGAVDLETANAGPPAGTRRTVTGRSPLHTGVAATLSNAVSHWLKAEEERDADDRGEVSEEIEKQLADIAGAVRGIDILAANLDSLHDALLGLPIGPYGVLQPRTATGIAKPVPVSAPELLVSGRLNVTKARLLDAFGRTLDLPVTMTFYPARDALDSGAQWRPRLLRPARWMFRFVDPADRSATAREATIDQVEPSLMVNPVAGFLLPDHIDEALEVFDTAGNPLGQLFHEPISGGVTWEIAPGRDGPPDAGPLYNLEPAQQILGHLAAAVVAKDAQTRAGLSAKPDAESALSALLRAIDTTLWTVDTYAVLGSTHVAGLVGRPIAVVRATLRLDILPDLDELDLSDAAKRAAREQAYQGLADRAFPVRIGEITRDDDGVMGFFVDDDYERFHIVDKVVRDAAVDAGRGRGQLGLIGTTPQVPAVRPITHPYVVAEDEISVRPGQTLRLTLLMHPGGKCHLSSGILPRKSLQLSRDWVHDGLAAIAPSARIGPVLIDADKVRLPLIASFGTEQLWTRRDGNYTWKNDPILAATQTALLPDAPATIEEGYVRIAPVQGGSGGSNGR
jgi:hypothetical protein